MFNIEDGDQYVTVAEAAALLGTSLSEVRRRIDTNEVESLTLIQRVSILPGIALAASHG